MIVDPNNIVRCEMASIGGCIHICVNIRTAEIQRRTATYLLMFLLAVWPVIIPRMTTMTKSKVSQLSRIFLSDRWNGDQTRVVIHTYNTHKPLIASYPWPLLVMEFLKYIILTRYFRTSGRVTVVFCITQACLNEATCHNYSLTERKESTDFCHCKKVSCPETNA